MKTGLSPKMKRNLARVAPFGIIHMVLGLFILFIQEAVTGNENINPETSISLTLEVFVFAIIAVGCVGLLMGCIEIFWLGKLFQNRSLAKKIVYKMGFYLLFILAVIVLTYPLAASIELEVPPWDSLVLQKFLNFLLSMDFYSTLVSLVVSLFLSLFYLEISDNLGHGVLMNFFTGKYHKPVEEKRVFLFLDMKSSTTIAEELGHITYFELLKSYYSDFSDAIVAHEGEVYQYIGDEIVISWPFEAGIKNSNCIRCFFAMKDSLDAKTEAYRTKFGVVPRFKAGLHYGKVTTGEIGALKKEIIFTGDVLNTTARIQGLCNSYQVDLLVSQRLIEALRLPAHLKPRDMGNTPLRGKEETVELFTVEREG
ncbi:adenylate/guanylate cyclase domain-containing protein [Zobellia russellii]|uniref:adenylate/guanylate cyclase domain-containing protein n=1 Tax=Zobellia russellii TaxID=248907 RepID=UPI001FECA692|nr:adenylate/guanylate cyclase domain-containing protein [Zobellia russellii]MBT9188811.1 adenylate/guanylate cyclase domain-containing protein [Zobellia russellii]